MCVQRRCWSWISVAVVSAGWLRPGGLMLACVLVAFAGKVEAAQERQQTVLTFYATRSGVPATSALDRAIEQTLGQGLPGRLDYHVEHLDLARFPEPAYQQATRDYLSTKYDHYRFDLIIATTSATLDFVNRFKDDLFPGTPVVFSSTPGARGGADATGVVSDLNFSATVEIVLQVQPDVRRVVVISGASPFDKYYETLARSQFKLFEGRLAFTYLTGLPLPDLLQQVARLPTDSVIYYLTVHEDGLGDKFIGVDALRRMAPLANVPIYSWHLIGLDNGIVGGSLLSMEVLGQRLGTLALRVLRGEPPGDIPVAEFNSNVVEFDWRLLRRWGLDERRLPAGSVVRFRQPGTWERYRGYIVAALSLLVLQTALIASLLFQRARRRRTESTLLARESALRASNQEIQNLAGRLLVAQEAERARIARDLHDDVSQQIAGLSIGLSSLRRRTRGTSSIAGVEAELSVLQESTIALAENIRQISHDLHPGVLQHTGLVSALSAHCAEVQRHQSVALTFSASDDVEPIDAGVALCLYRVAQEALRNVSTHARARRAELRLVRTDDHIELTVADDGRGFDAGGPRRDHGLGLVSINERVRLAGGTVSIVSGASNSGSHSGTTLSVLVPMGRTATEARDEVTAGRGTHA